MQDDIRFGSTVIACERGKVFTIDKKEIQADVRPRFPFSVRFSCDGKIFTEDDFVFKKREKSSDNAITDIFDCDVGLRVEAALLGDECGAYRQTVTAINESEREIRLDEFDCVTAGIAAETLFPYENEDVKLLYYDNVWCGEGHLNVRGLNECGVRRFALHEPASGFTLRSVGSRTTGEFMPFIGVTDGKKYWLVQLMPLHNWFITVSLNGYEQNPHSDLIVKTGAGSFLKDGFFVTLKKGEKYSSPSCLIAVGTGEFENALNSLNFFRRKYLYNRPENKIVFNDYMNCLWSNPVWEKEIPLIDKAAEIGVEVYCVDAGWYKDKTADWWGDLGDWRADSDRFGNFGLKGLVDYILQKGMIAGLWTELECCSASAKVAGKPDEWFLRCGGKRIFSDNRYYFDFENEEVRTYFAEVTDRIYKLGVRYIKNDYNGNYGFGADRDGFGYSAGGEVKAKAFLGFLNDIRAKYSDIIIEGCASGGMRSDLKFTSACDIVSFSDCEEHRYYPSILSGLIANVPPERLGLWVAPYPQFFGFMNDDDFFGKSVAEISENFDENRRAVLCGFLSFPYLSGRIDKADVGTLKMIKELITQYKKIADVISGGEIFFPRGLQNCAAIGYRKGERSVTFVEFKQGEQINLKVSAKYRRFYPSDKVVAEYKNGMLNLVAREYEREVIIDD